MVFTIYLLLHSHVFASRVREICRLKNKAIKPLCAQTRSRRVSHDYGNCTPDRVPVDCWISIMEQGGGPFIDFLFYFVSW
mgnify:CR=1